MCALLHVATRGTELPATCCEPMPGNLGCGFWDWRCCAAGERRNITPPALPHPQYLPTAALHCSPFIVRCICLLHRRRPIRVSALTTTAVTQLATPRQQQPRLKVNPLPARRALRWRLHSAHSPPTPTLMLTRATTQGRSSSHYCPSASVTRSVVGRPCPRFI
jgi:hypothetical protein